MNCERDKQDVRDGATRKDDTSDPSHFSRKSRANNKIRFTDVENAAGELFQQPAGHRPRVGGKIRALRSVSR